MSWYQWQGDDLVLTLHLQPRAGRNQIVGPHGDALKVRITAPPVDGKANVALIRYLADCFGVGRSQVQLLSGDTARSKRICIKSPRILPAESGVLRPSRGA